MSLKRFVAVLFYFLLGWGSVCLAEDLSQALTQADATLIDERASLLESIIKKRNGELAINVQPVKMRCPAELRHIEKVDEKIKKIICPKEYAKIGGSDARDDMEQKLGHPVEFTSPGEIPQKTWNTVSGKSYDIFKFYEWTPSAKNKNLGRAPGKFFTISYITSQKAGEKHKLLEEFYDIMAHFYRFHAPQNLKTKSFDEKLKYHVVVDALLAKPQRGQKNIHSRTFSKNFNGVARIAERYRE